MTAASAFPTESSEGRPAEPSMEDILASIRRIIADDQSQGGKVTASGNGARRAPAAPPAEADHAVARTRTPYDDVLDLARLVPAVQRTHDEPPPPVETRLAAVQNGSVARQAVAVEEDEDRPEPSHTAPASPLSGLRARLPEPVSRDPSEDEDNGRFDHPVPALSGGDEDLLSAPLGESVMSAFETLAATVVLQNTPMLERMMRDLVRPMLKTWLDDNLPAMVERLIRAEIERVARGTRG